MELNTERLSAALAAVVCAALVMAPACAGAQAEGSGSGAAGAARTPGSTPGAKPGDVPGVCSCCGAVIPQVPARVQPTSAVVATPRSIGFGAVIVNPSVTAASSAKANSLARVAEAMDGQLIAAFNGTRKFDVIGRSDLAAILLEQGFGASGLVSPETAARPGAIRGVDYLVITSLDDFQDVQTEHNFEGTGLKGTSRQIRVSAVAKLYDPSTGRLIDAANIQIEEIERAERKPDASADGELGDALLLRLARAAAERVAHRVVDVLYPARILALTKGQVTLNRGDGTGISVGQVWDAFALSEALIDPDTGASLGREEVRVGSIRITEVLPLAAKGEVVDGDGVAVQNVVRLKADPKPKQK